MPATSGQQVAAPGRELAEFGYRRGLLGPGQLAPFGVMPGGAGELGDEDAITARAPIAISHVPSVADLYGKYAPDCQDAAAPGVPGAGRSGVRW